MRITECEFVRFNIPFRVAFQHAAASRSHSDAIIIRVMTDDGVEGFGEIQARPYVTGEDNDTIWNKLVPLAGQIIGQSLATPEAVYQCLDSLVGYAKAPALAGGFDIALLDALDVEGRIAWQEIFGPRRASEPMKCLTIGENYAGDQLKNQARLARVGGYAVVKLKVAGSEDSARVRDLRDWLGWDIAIRLDANGAMNFSAASALLAACKDCKIESIEEPLGSASPQLADELLQLHEISGVPLVADESICTLADLESWARSGGYQAINVRIGKCGGISGAAAMLKAAKAAGFDVVAGTMVGETSVLLRASQKMLEYWNDLDYVEGIDQSRQLLIAEPVVVTKGQNDKHFEWVAKYVNEFCISRQIAN